jgi:microcystin-dependent protein
MASPYLSEIRIFSFNFAPKSWAQCNGQLMSIQQNAALFALIGTYYGGNGTTNFALPNLQGRVAMHVGNSFVQGQSAGTEYHTLTTSEIPQHSHQALASSNAPDKNVATNNYWASNTGMNPYGTSATETMAGNALATTGSSIGHENRSPYLVLNFCIALSGIFPSRS